MSTIFAYSLSRVDGGDGFAVVTDRFVCLLGAEATTIVANELYALLDSDWTRLDDVFDALVVRHNLPRFAIVEVVDPASRTFHLAVRGDIALELEGSTATRLSGASNAGWISSEARGVTSLSLSLGVEQPARENLPIRRGVVATGLIAIAEWASDSSARAAPEILKTEPIALPRLAPGIGGIRVPDAGGSTRVGIEPHVRDLPPIAWLLILPDGTEIEPTVPVVIGRRPWFGTTDERSVVHVVASSPHREISGVHLELSVVDGALHGRDLDSTNGTLVYSSSRPTRLLHGGRTTRLQIGDILDVGDAFSITVRTRI